MWKILKVIVWLSSLATKLPIHGLFSSTGLGSRKRERTAVAKRNTMWSSRQTEAFPLDLLVT